MVTIEGQMLKASKEDFILISPCVAHEIRSSDDAKFFIAIITPNFIGDFFEAHKSDIAFQFQTDNITQALIQKEMIENSSPSVWQIKA